MTGEECDCALCQLTTLLAVLGAPTPVDRADAAEAEALERYLVAQLTPAQQANLDQKEAELREAVQRGLGEFLAVVRWLAERP